MRGRRRRRGGAPRAGASSLLARRRCAAGSAGCCRCSLLAAGRLRLAAPVARRGRAASRSGASALETARAPPTRRAALARTRWRTIAWRPTAARRAVSPSCAAPPDATRWRLPRADPYYSTPRADVVMPCSLRSTGPPLDGEPRRLPEPRRHDPPDPDLRRQPDGRRALRRRRPHPAHPRAASSASTCARAATRCAWSARRAEVAVARKVLEELYGVLRGGDAGRARATCEAAVRMLDAGAATSSSRTSTRTCSPTSARAAASARRTCRSAATSS